MAASSASGSSDHGQATTVESLFARLEEYQAKNNESLIKTINQGQTEIMNRVETLLTQQADAQKHLTEKLHADLEHKLGKLEEKQNERIQSVAKRVELIEKQIRESTSTTTATSSSDLHGNKRGRANTDGDSVPAQPPAHHGPPQPAAKDGDKTDPLRIWVSGWPRPMVGEVMRQHTASILNKFPTFVKENVTIDARNTRKFCTIHFKKEEQVRTFLVGLRDQATDWVDPRSDNPINIRFRRDRSADDRETARVLGKFYCEVRGMLENRNEWTPDIKLGTTGPRGTLFIKKGDELWELFQAKRDDTSDIKITAKEGLAQWGFSEEDAKTIQLKALAAFEKEFGFRV